MTHRKLPSLLLGGILLSAFLSLLRVPLTTKASAQALPTVTTGPTPTPVPHTFSWRLPFDGTMVITNGPGEGFHTGLWSSEAIDFAPSPAASFNVLAPADGVVWDYFNVTDENDQNANQGFGRTLILYHTSTRTYSFFAHLRNDIEVDVSGLPGVHPSVTQGQLIAHSGNTGQGLGFPPSF